MTETHGSARGHRTSACGIAGAAAPEVRAIAAESGLGLFPELLGLRVTGAGKGLSRIAASENRPSGVSAVQKVHPLVDAPEAAPLAAEGLLR